MQENTETEKPHGRTRGDHHDTATDVPQAKEIGAVESGSSSSQEMGFDEKHTKKLIRKIDWALLPFLALLYLLSFLDRSKPLPLLSKPSLTQSKQILETLD
jgi:hypothetical protein